MENNGKKWWVQYATEWFRVLTPIALFLLAWSNGVVSSRFDRIDQNIINLDTKIFHHFTNDEIHIPRSTVVTKAEYETLRLMRDRQIDDFNRTICEIRDSIKDIQKQTRR